MCVHVCVNLLETVFVNVTTNKCFILYYLDVYWRWILTPLMSGASRASRVISFPAEFLYRSNQATGCRIMFVNASRRTLITSFSAAIDIHTIWNTAAIADNHARSMNMAVQNNAAFLSSSPVRVNVWYN